MVKTPRAYRLSDTTLDQVNWLKFRMGDITATDVITVAVAELYDRKKAELPLAQLIPQEDGFFDLAVQGEIAMRLSSDAIDDLPTEFKEKLIAGHAKIGDALVYLLLAAAKGGQKIDFNADVLQEALQDKNK